MKKGIGDPLDLTIHELHRESRIVPAFSVVANLCLPDVQYYG